MSLCECLEIILLSFSIFYNPLFVRNSFLYNLNLSFAQFLIHVFTTSCFIAKKIVYGLRNMRQYENQKKISRFYLQGISSTLSHREKWDENCWGGGRHIHQSGKSWSSIIKSYPKLFTGKSELKFKTQTTHSSLVSRLTCSTYYSVHIEKQNIKIKNGI